MLSLRLGDVQIEGNYDLDLPAMIPVKQSFDISCIRLEEIHDVVRKQFEAKNIKSKIKPGMKIAVGVGSRGISNLAEIVKCTIMEIKKLGAEPFIVPAMGSHGGATAEGQRNILIEYGITEEFVGAPIRSSMETVHLGKTRDGLDIFFDQTAYTEADGILVVARIKPHTDFKAPIESGIFKMIGIGLGKQKGASYLHRGGMDHFPRLIREVGQFIMDRTKFLFGVGIVENAYHETAMIEICLKEELPQKEEQLLVEAKRRMPKLQFDEIDVLVVDEIGKNISGSGMDSNIIGRANRNNVVVPFDAPNIKKIVVLGLTKETKGNASGIGFADFTTKRVVEEIDFSVIYTNAITAVEVIAGKIPLIFENDRKAIINAIRTGGQHRLEDVRVVRIKNTLSLAEIMVSSNMRTLIESTPSMEITGEAQEWMFNESGFLQSFNGR